MQSNAIEKSTKLMHTGACHSWNCSMMFRRAKICSEVPLPDRDPRCSYLIISSTALFTLSMSTLHKTLLDSESTDIPWQLSHRVRSPFFGTFTMSDLFHSSGTHWCFQLELKSTVQPKNNARARTSFCVRKPTTSCGFLRVACAWILQAART